MNSLTPDQAQALWKAGGFVVITDLPEGSEYGIDGVFHTTLSFSGTKFLPPGLHLITWSAPTTAPCKPVLDTASTPTGGNARHDSSQGPGAIPLRQAMFIFASPQSRYLLRYSPKTETLMLDKDAILSDEHLKSLDKSLAPYPFNALDGWKRLTSHVGEQTLRRVLGDEWKVDGLRRVEGEVDEVEVPQRPGVEEIGEVERPRHQVEEDPLKFTLFDSKRSWREGAVGEEVTRYSKDKSWLLGDVLRLLDIEPSNLIAELQLAFIIVVNLSSFGALQVFKRIVQITARASDLHLHPDRYITGTGTNRPSGRIIRQLYITLIQTIAEQLSALPAGVFDTELPELDIWLLGELDALRTNLREAVRLGVASAWTGEGSKVMQARTDVEVAWDALLRAGRRFRWELEPLRLQDTSRAELDEESEEEGEYAPVVVDM